MTEKAATVPKREELTARKIITVLILCFIILTSYLDRYALSGNSFIISTHSFNSWCDFFLVALLPVLIIDLDLSDAKGGLLQSSFVFSLIAFGPIIGFLGDRYSRRFLFWKKLNVVRMLWKFDAQDNNYNWFGVLEFGNAGRIVREFLRRSIGCPMFLRSWGSSFRITLSYHHQWSIHRC